VGGCRCFVAMTGQIQPSTTIGQLHAPSGRGLVE
jgi:hypothetical protein